MKRLFALNVMHIRSHLQFRGAFLLDRVAQLISYAAGFIVLWLLLQRFPSLGGWTWPELALLLSFQLFVYSVGASLSLVQMRSLDHLVQRGGFDVFLLSPVGAWSHLVFANGGPFGYAAHILLSCTVGAWALANVEVQWNAGLLLLLVVGLLSGIAIYTALITIFGALTFYIGRSRPAFLLFASLMVIAQYPLNIFPLAIQILMLVLVPVGFASYVPVAFLLGKEIVIIGNSGAILTPAVAIGMVVLAATVWRFGIRRYESAGG